MQWNFLDSKADNKKDATNFIEKLLAGTAPDEDSINRRSLSKRDAPRFVTANFPRLAEGLSKPQTKPKYFTYYFEADELEFFTEYSYN